MTFLCKMFKNSEPAISCETSANKCNHKTSLSTNYIPFNINSQGELYGLAGFDYFSRFQAFIKPIFGFFAIKAKGFTYSGQRVGFAFIRNCVALTSVILLFFSGRPLAILRRVITLAIQSIYGFTSRTLTHVFKKILKAIEPTITNLYPLSSIIFEKGNFRVIAPLLHAAPTVVSRTIGKSCFCIGNMKLPGSFAGKFAVKAATRFDSFKTKMVNSDCLFLSALTTAKNINTTVFNCAGNFLHKILLIIGCNKSTKIKQTVGVIGYAF